MNIDEGTLNIRKGMGQSAVENLQDWLARKAKTRQEALAGVTLFFHEPDRAETFTEEILLESGGATVPIGRPLQMALEREVVRQWVKRVASWDAVSQLSVSTHNETRAWEPYWMYNELVWVRALLTPGQFGVIGGEGLGVGKTGFGVRLMAPTLREGHHVVTNIRLFEHPAPGRVHFVTKLSDLLRLAIDLSRRGEKWVGFLDEVNFFFSRRDAGKAESKHMEKFFRWVRKLAGSLVLITHFSESDVPEIVRPLLTTRIEKVAKPRMRVEIRSPDFSFFARVRGVPDASKEDGWAYDTNAKAGFDVDVDIRHLQAWVNRKNPSSEEVELDLILRYLDERPSPDDDPGEGETTPAEREVNPLVAIAEEVAANRDTYRKTNGKMDVDAILREFPDLSVNQAYQVGRLARARGG